MIEAEISFDVKRPPADVFAFLVEPQNTSRWVAFCQSLTKVSDGPTAVGTRLHYAYKDGMRRGTMEGQVTEHQPGQRLAYLYTDRTLDVAVGFRFAATGAGTKIDHWCKITPKNFFMKLMTPLIRSATQKQMGRDTAKLKEILEGAK